MGQESSKQELLTSNHMLDKDSAWCDVTRGKILTCHKRAHFTSTDRNLTTAESQSQNHSEYV